MLPGRTLRKEGASAIVANACGTRSSPSPSGHWRPRPSPQEKLSPLPLVLPKPLFVGTPVPLNVANLEKPTGIKRPPFLAPAGTVNLALGKPVTASDTYPAHRRDPVRDRRRQGRLGRDLRRVRARRCNGRRSTWARPATLYAIVCWHFHAQARAYYRVIVQVSDDPTFKTGVQTLFNNDVDNKAGLGAGKDPVYVETSEGRLIDAKGWRARYVRLYSDGNTMSALNHYVEVEVFGRK